MARKWKKETEQYFGPSFLVPFLLLQLMLLLANFGALNNVQQQLMEPMALEYTSSTIVCNNLLSNLISMDNMRYLGLILLTQEEVHIFMNNS